MSTAPSLDESWAFELTVPGGTAVHPYVARIPMTEEQFLRWDHGNRLAEWVDGEAFVYMTSTFNHERIAQFINFLLGGYVIRRKAGRVVRGPFAMRVVPGSRIREPDLFYISNESAGRIERLGLQGAADIAVEVVSDDSATRDRRDKLREYEGAGVREYWVIDSREKRRTAAFHVLEGGAYVDAPTPRGVFHSRALPGFWMKDEWLWDEDADPLACLDEVLGGEPG